MKKIFIVLLCFISTFFAVMILSSCESSTTNSDFTERKNIEPDEYDSGTIAQIKDNFHLIWADEFNYVGSPDASKWNYEVGTGNGGWGNNEEQFYTNRDDNSYVDNGYLTITAKKENYGGSNYTSARLTTKNKGDWTYGYIEMRAILPSGVGTWPAFWMMPTDSVYGWWPNSGEIDIMEMVGRQPTRIMGTVHTQAVHGSGTGSSTTVATSTTDWNKYAIEWNESYIKWYVNDKLYFTYFKKTNASSDTWPFDQNFFVILNVAMGGNLGGTISSDFVEAQMKVDYVRVYKQIDTTDNIKPSKPSIKKYVAKYDSIDLEWDSATDNQGIKQYDIVLDNKQIGATISNCYTIKNLNAATTYQVRIIAVDYNNNWTISDPISVRTLDVVKIPGKVYGYGYSDATKSVLITTGSDTDTGGGNILRIPSNTTVSYNVKCTSSGNFDVELRLQGLISTNIQIEVYSNSTLLGSSNTSVSNTFGNYVNVAFPDKISLPSNSDITIKLIFTSAQQGNAVNLNYINIK